MLWNYWLKNLNLTIFWFFAWSPQVPILLYSSKNVKNSYNFILCFKIYMNSYNFYSYVLKCRKNLSVSIKNSYNFYTYLLKYKKQFIRVSSCCFIFFMVDDQLDKLETRNEKWEMITCQNNLSFLNLLFVNNIMVLYIKNQ